MSDEHARWSVLSAGDRHPSRRREFLCLLAACNGRGAAPVRSRRGSRPGPGRSGSTPTGTGPSVTGTHSCRGSRPDSCTAIGPSGRTTPPRAIASTAPRCCSTLTPAPSPTPTRTRARPRATPATTASQCMKSVVMDPRGYDWEGDAPLRRPLAESVIYELHVGGFTRHPNSGVSPEKRGTYAGLIEKIPYLQGAGRDRRGIAPGAAIRRAGRSAAPDQLLGLQPGRLLRPAPRIQLLLRAPRPGIRLPRHGQGAPPSGHRGDPGRGLQPHRRRRSHWARRSAFAAWKTGSTTSSSRIAPTTPTSPVAATRSRGTIRSCVG